jgi:hypothetical protein
MSALHARGLAAHAKEDTLERSTCTQCTLRWIGITVLAALAMLVTMPWRVSAHSSLPAKEYMVVTPWEWLNGHGVGVYYPSTPDEDHPQNDDGTVQYECVELVVRLYARLGYTDHWPVRYAHEIAGIAGQPGFADLIFSANGRMVPPRQGDIVVWDNWYNDGAGHVAVVNRVDGDQVQIVHQNVWRENQPVPFSEMTLWQDRQGRFTLAGQDGTRPVGWMHSPRMARWLRARLPVVPVAGAHRRV